MGWVAGIDGCRAGWVVVLVEHKAGGVRHHHIRLCPSFADVLAMHPKPIAIAVDIPIGLLDRPEPSGRECDGQARKLLSRRAGSIFSPPTRPMLKATRYDQVRSQGLSIQSFNILPKIREVDRLMTPDVQQRVHEAHPELAFAALAGTPMQYNKKTLEGREERRKVFESLFLRRGEKSPFAFPFEKRGKRKAPGDCYKYFPRSYVSPMIFSTPAPSPGPHSVSAVGRRIVFLTARRLKDYGWRFGFRQS
jgi:predicted RNase H-like nuclease